MNAATEATEKEKEKEGEDEAGEEYREEGDVLDERWTAAILLPS